MELPESAQEEIERFLEEVARWGARMNLVGSTALEDLRMHAQEALAAVPAIPPRARVVDLGSGAGFPGVPIAIARPDLEVTLVERREKRVHFLRHVVRTLGLRCEVRRQSIETPPPVRGFDVVLTRAVAPAERALEIAAPWAGPGGQIWLWTRDPLEGYEEHGSLPLGRGGRVARILARDVPRGASRRR